MASKHARAKLSLKARAIQWLAMREHSRVELRRKLLAQIAKEEWMDAAALVTRNDRDAHEDSCRVDDHASDVDVLLDQLMSQGHLSEQRFIESRLGARTLKHGNQRIRAELSQHGVALSTNQAKALADSEHLRAYALWARRFGGLRAEENSERVKQMRFLAGRGFSTDVVRRVVDGRAPPPSQDEHADTAPSALK